MPQNSLYMEFRISKLIKEIKDKIIKKYDSGSGIARKQLAFYWNVVNITPRYCAVNLYLRQHGFGLEFI